MSEFDFSREFDIANGRQGSGKSRNMVEFFLEPMLDEGASEKAGRPIHKDVTLIRIIIPGDMRNIVERRANADDKAKYAREWEAFERQESTAQIGTPLEHWSVMTRAMVRQLKHFQIHTVDSLAGLSDANVSDVGILGLRTLRKQAQMYLETAATGSAPARLVSENERLDGEVAQLRAALTEANTRYEALLRDRGANVSAHEQIAVATPPPQHVETPKLVIPDDIKRMSNKELFDFVERTCGIKVRTRADAESAIEELRAAA